MLTSLLNWKERWSVKTGQLDRRYKPEVVCKHAGTEYCFRRGWREERLVWLCWRRERLFFSSMKHLVGRAEGTPVVEHAREMLQSLEPSLEVHFDED